jgi:primosomal protein N' (replication factor Y)
LFLIPEIILTNQLSNKIKNVFWKEVIIINSTITDATKTKYWINIYNVDSKIIIWTRSALFYPYNNLWLIIIDEEHDNSYISDSAPRYNAIEVAEKISELNWNKLVIASGTPSIKSMYKAIKWDYEIVNLLKKYK